MTDPALAVLVEQLTTTHDAEVDDRGQLRRQPPLLAALADAHSATVIRGSSSSKKALHERLSLNLDAFQLQSEIQATVRTWALQVGYQPPPAGWPTADELLRAWADRVETITPLDPAAYLPVLTGWVEAIGDLIDPPYRYTLTAPCPTCGATWISNGDDHGYALHVTERIPAAHSVTTCRGCGTTWRGIDGAHTLNALIRTARSA